jgi:hypothetical protein
MQRVYWGISSFLVFTTVSLSDSPMRSLREEGNEQVYYPARWAVTALYYLPVVVLAFVIFTDFYHFHEPLIPSVPPDAKTKAKGQLMDACAIVVGLLMTTLCHKIDQFERATTSMLREYRRELKIREAAAATTSTQEGRKAATA